jgi:hypothetical protein
MSTETSDKIKIEWDDLKTRKVDQRLKEQEALERNRRQAAMSPVNVQVEKPERKSSIFYNPVFLLAIFGLLGGLLAWGGGELLGAGPDLDAQAQSLKRQVTDLMQRSAVGESATPDVVQQVAAAVNEIKVENAGNPYFALAMNTNLTPEQRAARKAEIDHQQSVKNLIANILSFGVSGMLIAACLSIAEPLIDRNYHRAMVNGFVGGMLGLVGGAVVSLFIEKVYAALVVRGPDGEEVASARMLAEAVKWGILGLFLTIAPGVLMGNVKKLSIGLVGGLIGGVIGGALFDPIYNATDGNMHVAQMIGNIHVSRMIALVAIGLFAGAATGLIENAAKGGWLKVTSGLIAGKQFILYRNPTFIGSGPECPIYLFRDPKIGKRHAAIHIVPGGFELENLPLGTDTYVNGKTIKRARLRNSDEIKIGGTTFRFQEKTSTKT